MCKLHHVCGSVGRIVSTFLITAMSFDRYVAICHPHHTYLRSRSFVLGVISCLSILAFFLLLPMLTYARAKEMVLHELKALGQLQHYTGSSLQMFGYDAAADILLVHIDNIHSWLCRAVDSYCVLQLEAYSVLPRSSIPLRRVVMYTVLIAAVYFVCWTPYWFSVLYAIVMSLVGLPTTNSELL
ncbi:hypothetical protein OSTOST_12216, partial [Ostertagia ostertagi]